MDIISREDIQELMDMQGDPMISVYMPARKVGQETLENPIHFKNLMLEVEALLRLRGNNEGEIRDLLSPLSELLDDGDFWQHQEEGLAVFRSPDNFRTLRLPVAVQASAIVNNRFYTRPLLPMLHSNGSFYLLALSMDNVRLFECDRHTCQAVDLGDVPTSMRAALGDEQLTHTLNFHTKAQPGPGGERMGIYFGKGSSNESHKKEDIQRYFTILENGITKRINQSNQPLVLAGVEYLLPIYREKNRYPHLVEPALSGNPEDRRVEDMHCEAWALVEPLMNQARLDAIDAYHILRNDRQASADIREIVPAAWFGQVDILLVGMVSKVWGQFDPETQAVRIHDRRELNDEDLTDLAAKFTLANSGLVYTYDLSEMPDGTPAAATLRYPLRGLNYSVDDEKYDQKNRLK